MFKNYLNGIDGIATYPVFSLLVFFLFFVSLSIWLFLADKKHLNELAQIPFNESNENNSDQLIN